MSGLEREKLFVCSVDVCDLTYDETHYPYTYTPSDIQVQIESVMDYCKTGNWYSANRGQEIDGEYIEWRVAITSCGIVLSGFIDEPEDEWKARVEAANKKKQQDEEKERKKLAELMKKYPDVVKENTVKGKK